MSYIVFDVEANGYREVADKVWVLSYAIDEEEVVSDYSDTGEIDYERFLDVCSRCNILVGHNILNYDLPLLKRLYRSLPDGLDFVDTVVWSRLLWPDLPSPDGWVGKPQPHSLEAWAMRFGGEQKVAQEDWSKFDPNMIQRCESDVRLTRQLYKKILEETK